MKTYSAESRRVTRRPKIRDVQMDIEDSLASLPTASLPPELEGLRHLPTGDRNPQVSIRRMDSNRKIRADADASYFDPDMCEVVISFVPFDESDYQDGQRGPSDASADRASDEFDVEEAMDQLIDQLQRAEGMRPFVGLKWFRDQFLPECGHNWAQDPRARGALLRHSTERRLILTSQVPNPNQPLHPVTAIRVNRRHLRLHGEAPDHGPGFRPIPIRGGLISDTVLSDRR